MHVEAELGARDVARERLARDQRVGPVGAAGAGHWWARLVSGCSSDGECATSSETLREPLAAMHTALLGLVGLVLAFGLALAVGRYETRRTALVDESNTIGTTYLRAQTLAEPVRTPSLETLRRYTDNSILLADAVPGSGAMDEAVSAGEELQRRLWAWPANRSTTRPKTRLRASMSRASTR